MPAGIVAAKQRLFRHFAKGTDLFLVVNIFLLDPNSVKLSQMERVPEHLSLAYSAL